MTSDDTVGPRWVWGICTCTSDIPVVRWFIRQRCLTPKLNSVPQDPHEERRELIHPKLSSEFNMFVLVSSAINKYVNK